MAEMPADDGDEVRIVLGGKNREGVPDDAEDDPGDPELQPKAKRRLAPPNCGVTSGAP